MKKIILTVAAALAAGAFAMPAGFTDDFDAALKKAADEKKTVFALFTGSDWCIWCKRLEGEVLSQKAFSDEVGKTFVPVFLDFPNDKSLVKAATAKRNRELAEKYLAHVKGLVQKGPLLQKHVKPYEKRFEGLGRKMGESANAVAAKVAGDHEAKEKAVKAAFPTIVGPILVEMKTLRKDLAAEQVPEAIADDKDGLLKQIDKAIEFLTKASKGELP